MLKNIIKNNHIRTIKKITVLLLLFNYGIYHHLMEESKIYKKNDAEYVVFFINRKVNSQASFFCIKAHYLLFHFEVKLTLLSIRIKHKSSLDPHFLDDFVLLHTLFLRIGLYHPFYTLSLHPTLHMKRFRFL